MFSRIILVVLATISVLLIYWGFIKDSDFYFRLSIPFVLMLATVYVLSPQINWWYYNKYPQELDRPIRHLINQQSKFYQGLSLEGKKRFRKRMSLFLMAHDFQGMVIEKVPEDIKAVVAANVVHLTFGLPDYLMKRFEKVIIYPNTFPSPQFPKHFHSSEIYAEDGVIMFSAQHLMKGFVQPEAYYNSGLHEAIQAFIVLNPNKNYPTLPEDIWKQLETISRYPVKSVKQWIGLEDVNPLVVSICHFLMFPTHFSKTLPQLFDSIKELLNLNPLETHQPILYINDSY
jgi:hypothetical protein